MENKIKQIKGKNNGAVKDPYRLHIIEFLNKANLEVTGDLDLNGILYLDNKYIDASNIPEKVTDLILSRTSLEYKFQEKLIGDTIIFERTVITQPPKVIEAKKLTMTRLQNLKIEKVIVEDKFTSLDSDCSIDSVEAKFVELQGEADIKHIKAEELHANKLTKPLASIEGVKDLVVIKCPLVKLSDIKAEVIYLQDVNQIDIDSTVEADHVHINNCQNLKIASDVKINLLELKRTNINSDTTFSNVVELEIT